MEMRNSDHPAMPLLGYGRSASGDIRPEPTVYSGLTKRELFAAMAMQGILSNPDMTTSIARLRGDDDGDAFAANLALEHADALLTALEKEPTP